MSTGPLALPIPILSSVPLPADLPPHIISLAREIARQCAAPGEYEVKLRVGSYPSEPIDATISRVETIRVMELKRKNSPDT